ncbi:hypothetical protein BHE74_00003077 [Ensete ventricosum]|nr:hypothetical protein BHE74_00003077 [Ensete ventricosum]RZR92121.1 hypothetical protein BHM03_00020374 [Ensete ventricosum]
MLMVGATYDMAMWVAGSVGKANGALGAGVPSVRDLAGSLEAATARGRSSIRHRQC